MFVADGGLEDTIVARATAAGPGARAILRISGGAAFALAARVFEGPLDRAHPRLRVAGVVGIEDVRVPAAAIGWTAPRSYTGEDLVELHLVSSPPLLERLVEALVRAGARPARPGEFTRRAYLGGKLDLAASEAVLALGQATTEDEARAAVRELRGGLGREAERLRGALLDALAELEAALDFAHEDIERDLLTRAGFLATLTGSRAAVDRLLSRESGRAAGDRPPAAVLLGPPNAGKSSLLNALAGRDVALVSATAGTTRDAVSARVRMGTTELELVDVAGVKERTTEDAEDTEVREKAFAAASVSSVPSVVRSFVDAEARSRAKSVAASADLVLVVIDGSVAFDDAARAALAAVPDRPRIVVLQKSDLPRVAALDGPVAAVSAKTGAGLDDLRAAISGALAPRAGEGAGVGPNARHRACLERARDRLAAAIAASAAGEPDEIVAIELRAALDALGEITGASCPEDVLDRIFARFCIGK